MIKIKDIGQFEFLPEILNDVIEEDISALEKDLLNGWDIDKKISLSQYIDISPLDIALIMNRFQAVEWLVKKGVELNMKDNPSFLVAVRYCHEEVIRYLVSHGAKVNEVNYVGSDAFKEAYYGKRFENFGIIHELGHEVDKYGGNVFRTAVGDRNYQVMDFLIKHGVDVNYHQADRVYPLRSSPLCVAARYVDLAMCQYLVEHGADVRLTEKDGMRPFSIALEKGDVEMAEYFKSLEPKEYHRVQNKLDALKDYKLPKSLIEFLQGNSLHFDLEDCGFKSIDFFSLVDSIEMKVGRQKLLRISRTTGDYTHIHIVWNPKTKKVASYDMEHKKVHDFCGFEDFIKDMGKYMNVLIS